MTLNLWHNWPRLWRWQDRLAQVAHLVADLDVDLLLLQEVVHRGEWAADRWLAERLGMDRVFAQANGLRRGRRHFCTEGVAILSRFPLQHAHHLALGGGGLPPCSRRVALGAWVTPAPGQRLWVANIHLGLAPWRQGEQIQRVIAWVEAQAGPHSALLGGDFNADETSPTIHAARQAWVDLYRQQHPQGRAGTYSFHLPFLGEVLPRRLDYLYLRPARQGPVWHVLEARILRPEPRLSDHRPVLVRLGLSPREASNNATAGEPS